MTKKKRVVKVTAWLSTSEHEVKRNFAWVNFQEEKPETDTNYECERVVIIRTLTPKRKGKA